MYTTRLAQRVPKSQLSRAASSFSHANSLCSYGLRSGYVPLKQQQQLQHQQRTRQFSSTSILGMKDIFPEPDAPHIRKTEPAWPHPPFDEKEMRDNIYYVHREPVDFSDRVALKLIRFLRWGTDLATGYKHDVESPKKVGDTNALTETKPYGMSERKWLIRFIFLESVAGVPGMVAGMLRHLHSIRRLKRDNGWIETLLEEAYNERMHLLTFLKMAQPGWFMKFMCLGAQGVIFNSLFVSYLISPRTVHRFVGYIEEEAVLTYTLAIQDLEAGKLPKWEAIDPKTGERTTMQAPDIAISYWNMPEGRRSIRDLLLYVRADEAKHREVNHTLANLDQKNDPNPFNSVYKDETKPHPEKGITHTKGQGWEREEVI